MSVQFLKSVGMPGPLFGDAAAWLIADGAGGQRFVVTDDIYQPTNPQFTAWTVDVRARFLAPATSAQPNAFSPTGVVSHYAGANADYFEAVAVAGLGNGGYAVAIDHDGGQGSDTMLRFVSAAGVVTATFAMPGSSTHSVFTSGLARLDDGRILNTSTDVTFDANGGLIDAEVRGQFFSQAGAALGASFAINADSSGATGGGALVAFGLGYAQVMSHYAITAGNRHGTDLRVRVLDAAGQPAGSDITIAPIGVGKTDYGGLVANSTASGGLEVFWVEQSADPTDAPQAGFTQTWVVRYAVTDKAGAVTASGQLQSGARTFDGAQWTGNDVPDLVSADLANGGAALQVRKFSNSMTGPSWVSDIYTFDRFGLIATDFDALPHNGYSSIATAADGTTLVTDTSSASFYRIAPTGIVGTAGADTLYGDRDVNDVMSGGAGDDTLFGLSGNDTLQGGTGDDRLIGGDGADTLQGDAGQDTADYSAAPAAVIVDLSLTGAQNTGGAGTDTLASIENLTGSAFADTLTGGAGPNVIDGGAGADVIRGGAGFDTLLGGDGNDTIFGGADIDVVYAGAGDDYIQGDAGASSVLSGEAGNDTIYGGAGADYMIGGDGNDVMVGLGGQDSLYGGAGNDYMVAGNGVGTVLDGGAGANSLWGAGGNDYAVGGEGADIIVTGGGNDYIFGLAGNDAIYAGFGTDYIYGNAGDDFIYTDDFGANYTDYVYAGYGTGKDTVVDFKAGAGTGHDVVVISGVYTSFAQVQANISQVGAYAVVQVSANDAVYLYNVTASTLTADNFLLL